MQIQVQSDLMFASFVCKSTSPQRMSCPCLFYQTYLRAAAWMLYKLINQSDCVAFYQSLQVEVKPCVLLMYVKATLVEKTLVLVSGPEERNAEVNCHSLS